MTTTTTLNKTAIMIFLAVFGVLLYLLSSVLTPFLIATLIAYLFDPLIGKMMRWRLPRLACVIIVFIVITLLSAGLVLLLIPLIQKELALLQDVIPNTIEWLQNTILPSLSANFGIDEVVNINTLKTFLADHWAKAGGAATWVLQNVLKSGLTVLEWTMNLLLVPVVTFYLLRDWNTILNNICRVLPRRVEPTLVRLAKSSDEVLSAFFRGQLLVMLSLGAIYSTGLTVIGLKVGLIIGLVSGLISIVPYLGFIVGIVAASIAAMVQYGDMMHVGLVWLVFAIGQILEGSVLTPMFVGDRIGLHPVAVIFAVLAGASLFGFFGVLLALPVAAVLMVWIRYFLLREAKHA